MDSSTFDTCQYCNIMLPSNQIQESHDVPCYLFEGKTRKERKNQADKFGRHNLCYNCHKYYEGLVAAVIVKDLPLDIKDNMKKTAQSLAESYFKKKEETKDDTEST